MERYEEYKDSGVEWIGEIPVGWEVKKLKYIAFLKTGYTPSKEEKENYSDDGITWVKPNDLMGFNPVCESKEKVSKLGLKVQNIVPKGSLLVCCIGSVGKYGVAGLPLITNQQINALVFSHHDFVTDVFGGYLIAASVDEHERNANGNVVKILNTENQGSIFFPIPPKPKQTAIANFLGRKTAEIDALIAPKECLLELYKEEKTAIINHAVTKGIDPNAELKDSGVEWIGEIPVGWDVKKIKHRCYVKGRVGWKGLKSREFLIEGFSYLVTGTDFKGGKVDWKGCYQIDKDRYEEDPYIQLHEHDLLITKDGTIGKLAIIDELDKPACLNSGIFVVRSLNRDFATRYLYWVLMSNVFTQFNNYTSYGSTIRHLYQNVFVEFSFGFPTPEEQTSIANFLDRKTVEIDAQIAKTQRIIELQREYRTTLISDVVTGKSKVPHLADEEIAQ